MDRGEQYLTNQREYHRQQFTAEVRELVQHFTRVLDRAEKCEGFDIGSNTVAAVAELVGRAQMMKGLQKGIEELRAAQKVRA